MNEKREKPPEIKKKLQQEIEECNQIEYKIAEHEKTIKGLNDEKGKKERKILIHAARYFTKEKIIELKKKSEEELHSYDIDEVDLIEQFSDLNKLKYNTVIFLTEREDELNEEAKTLEDIENRKGKKSTLDMIDFLFRKGGKNYD